MSPRLHEDADVRGERLAVELKLEVRATAPWVRAPALLLLHHAGRSFEIEVDPTALPPGLHTAAVEGYDAGAEWRGPLFRIPITVIKPVATAPARVEAAAGGGGGGGGVTVRGDHSLLFSERRRGAVHRVWVVCKLACCGHLAVIQKLRMLCCFFRLN